MSVAKVSKLFLKQISTGYQRWTNKEREIKTEEKENGSNKGNKRWDKGETKWKVNTKPAEEVNFFFFWSKGKENNHENKKKEGN